eukprot:SAG11_NODE_27817_length_328_cov_1.606987_1_plen_86_part_01
MKQHHHYTQKNTQPRFKSGSPRTGRGDVGATSPQPHQATPTPLASLQQGRNKRQTVLGVRNAKKLRQKSGGGGSGWGWVIASGWGG